MTDEVSRWSSIGFLAMMLSAGYFVLTLDLRVEYGGRGALHLQVDRESRAAKELYCQFGFEHHERQFLTADLRSDQQRERAEE